MTKRCEQSDPFPDYLYREYIAGLRTESSQPPTPLTDEELRNEKESRRRHLLVAIDEANNFYDQQGIGEPISVEDLPGVTAVRVNGLQVEHRIPKHPVI